MANAEPESLQWSVQCWSGPFVKSTERFKTNNFLCLDFMSMYTQLQRLESATEMEILRRYELAARLDRPDGTPWSGDERQKLEKEVDLCEARRQALVLLLLHYSSGLQNVEETERDSKLCD